MKKGLNFRTIESQKEYFKTYDKSLNLMNVEIEEKYVTTTYGYSHVICCGDHKKHHSYYYMQLAVVLLYGIKIWKLGVNISIFMPST